LAQSRAISLSSKLEEEWHTLRLLNKESVLSRFLMTRSKFDGTPYSAPKMSEAKKLYLDAKSEGKSKTFWQSADRCTKFVFDLLGDRPIDTYERNEVNQIRDAYVQSGLSRSSIKRNLSTIRAIVNFAARETGLSEVNAFSGIYLGEDDQSKRKKRPSFPNKIIRKIQHECYEVNDQARWLIAMVSDSGMRLSEAAGLLISDIRLDTEIPHVTLRHHPWRRLKTADRERNVPLLGASLWAAQQAVENAQSKFLFPRYCSEKECKANSASAALNKWISPRSPQGCVIHSFRHSMRDRLRAVE
jgi:integrase